MIKGRSWKYFIYALMACYVVFIVASMSIMNRLIQEGQEYAVNTTRSTRELRGLFNEIENIMPALLSSPHLEQPDVLNEFTRLKNAELEALAKLERDYKGDSSLLAQIRRQILKFADMQQEAADKLDGNLSYELSSAYFRHTLKPEIEAINDTLAGISREIDRQAHEIHVEMHNGMNIVVLASLFFGFMIIGIAVLYDRRVHQAALELAYRDELFRQLARNIDEVFIIAINGSSYEYVGQNSDRLLNLKAGELHEHPEALAALLPPEDATWLNSVLNGEPLPAPVERNITLADGRYLKIRIYSIRVPSTQAQRFIMVVNDQTEITTHQLALSDALDNAHAASAAKSSFLSHMSHEIRTPMNAIIGMTTIALSRIGDQQRVLDCLGKISNSSRHLLGLINDVLDMSKIESGKLSLCSEDFNLQQVIDNIRNIVSPQAQNRGQNFEIIVEEDVTAENLVGDAMRLNQVLLNILSNAVKFTPDGGSVTLRLGQSTASQNNVLMRFIISDTGIGMSPEFLEKLFLPFEQAHANTASRFGGTGLGMPITMNLVTMMGGTINVQSSEGKGTVFTLDIPFAIAGETVKYDDKLPNLKILIVDDDSDTCEHASLLLEKMGLSPTWTLSGRHAVELVQDALAANDPFDVCLIDWRMPEMDGAQTARAIRSIAGAEMLIIIISAYDLAPIENEARQAGANNFIAKPFFASTLMDALASATRRSGEDAATGGKPQYDFQGKRILLAEDNEFNREIADEFLEMVNIEVENAENGKEARDMLAASQPGHYDLILMDIQMPVMDGYEATRAIRASGHADAASIPIIAMTANAFNEDVARAVAAGMNAHIPKPIDINELYRVLAQYLGNGNS